MLPARAQDDSSPGDIQYLSLGGAPAAAPSSSADIRRGVLLLDAIRRRYDRPLSSHSGSSELLPAVNAAGAAGGVGPILPLPLPADVWIQAVFDGREQAQTLLPAILGSRGSALLYYGLFSLDDDTRSWLATRPRFVRDLAWEHAAAFVIAAPGLRIRGGAVSPPGGDDAAVAWEALVEHRVTDAEGFTRALLTRDNGRLAFVFGALAQLTPQELRVALQLDAPAPARVDAARRLRGVFTRILADWQAERHVFWRPPLDPVMLLSGLRRDANGLPVLRGTRAFWATVFSNPGRTVPAPAAAGEGPPADLAWLSEQVFTGDRALHRRRYELVLFVSRLADRDPRWTSAAAIPVLAELQAYPALTLSLERANLTDVEVFSAAAGRASAIASVRDHARARRAILQFQGALAIVLRTAARHAQPVAELGPVVASLSSVDLSSAGEYEGRLVSWFANWLEGYRQPATSLTSAFQSPGAVEADVISALAGRMQDRPRFVDWEGTRYRLDFTSPEAIRIARHLGERPRALLSAAVRFLAMHREVSATGLNANDVARLMTALDQIATSLEWIDPDGTVHGEAPKSYKEIRSALTRGRDGLSTRRTLRLRDHLLALTDDLFADGVAQLVYAVSFGQPERATISAAEAAARHTFSAGSTDRMAAAWELPWTGSVPHGTWRVTGSLLGLDVRLAEFRLLRISSRPPSMKPTLPTDQRRVLVEAAALADSALLDDADRTNIVEALRRGRLRLATARSPDDVSALADEIRLSPLRRTLLRSAFVRQGAGSEEMLTLTELLWLGMERGRVTPSWHAWGGFAAPRTGCLCLELLEPPAWEHLTRRVHSGVLVSVFADLNLRLAELLEELGMPAALLAPVLAAATLDLVENAAVSDADDLPALSAFVRGLRRERVEDYLALLTADGPLVPAGQGGAR